MIKKLIKKYTEYKILKLKTDIDNVMLYRISIMLSEDFSDKKLLEVNELSINLFFHIINNEKLSETLFEIKEKILKDSIFNKFLSTRYLLFSYYSEILEYFIIILCLTLLIISYLIKKEVNIYILIIFLMVLLFLILSKIKLFNYLENPTSIFLFIIGLIMFSSQLALKINKDIINILEGEKTIDINLKDKYERFEDLNFITMNSNYIFLWDKKENKSIVLPLSTISNLNSIEIKK